jgi:hypothetical protein
MINPKRTIYLFLIDDLQTNIQWAEQGVQA